jgi:SAM-dependent methyltransferase
MGILQLNKGAWNKIGAKIASPVIKNKGYLKMFNLFCKKLPKNGIVLDLGCGPGIPITKELIKRRFLVTGIDLSDKMIKLARKNAPNAKYQCISMTSIKFNDKFDGIISSYSMLCLNPKDFKRTASKISTALKKGGYFLLVLNERIKKHKEKESYVKIMNQKMYSRPYTEKEIRRIFKNYNMKTIKVDREIIFSKNYGKEHSLLMLLKKEGP